jgi:hypothetical protein
MKLMKPGAVLIAVILAIPASADAQTDYYNTDAGRPLTIEDASPVERHAFEVQVAPLRLERRRGGSYIWTVEPEIAYGILPRTQLEIGAPLSYVDAGRGRSGLGGIELSLMHSLNNETSLPAFAVAGDVLLPVGGLAPDDPVVSAKGIMTRTFTWARFHVNGQYTFDRGGDIGGGHSNPEWLAGIAADRALPLMSTLFGVELVAEQDRGENQPVVWSAATGVRRQLTPAFNIDAGLGRRLSGDDQGWFFTFGLARAFAIRSLMGSQSR